MRRLCDLRSRELVVTCGPCARRGVYRMDRLRERFGKHASIMDVYLELTQSCRWQRPVGSRIPNPYGTVCRAKAELAGDDDRRPPPSRT